MAQKNEFSTYFQEPLKSILNLPVTGEVYYIIL